MTPEAIQAVERFVGAWADPFVALHLAPRLNVNLLESLANLLTEAGEAEIAKQWLQFS